MIAVACLTILVSHFYMGNMGEINTVRLPGIDEPRYLFVGGNVFLKEFVFFWRFSKGGFWIIVAFGALFELRDTGKGPIFSEHVAKQASFFL